MAEKDKLTSLVWNYFQLVETGGVKKTVCQLCDVKLAYQSGSTKSMWNHLRAKHENKLAEKKAETKGIHVNKSKQSMITSFAKGTVMSKDKKVASYMAAAEVSMSELTPGLNYHVTNDSSCICMIATVVFLHL